jgi:hypothetical protein
VSTCSQAGWQNLEFQLTFCIIARACVGRHVLRIRRTLFKVNTASGFTILTWRTDESCVFNSSSKVLQTIAIMNFSKLETVLRRTCLYGKTWEIYLKSISNERKLFSKETKIKTREGRNEHLVISLCILSINICFREIMRSIKVYLVIRICIFVH